MAKVMIADHEEHFLLLFLKRLEDAGYETVTVNTGGGLIEGIREEGPDLIVLDIRLIEYNGLDLVQDIRSYYYDMPVAISTARDSFKDDLGTRAADHHTE
ncbi:MAG: response regulator [Syntrophobacteraceae bacterium]|nr:response regulator [Syntrophobacteraceae bacterium]